MEKAEQARCVVLGHVSTAAGVEVQIPPSRSKVDFSRWLVMSGALLGGCTVEKSPSLLAGPTKTQ